MAQITQGAKFGVYKVLIQKVGESGASYGQAGSGLSAGSATHPYVADYPKSVGFSLPDRTTIDFTGGDRWVSSFQFGINSLGSFDMTLQDVDADLIALVTGSTVDQSTNTRWTTYSENTLATLLPQMSLMVIYRIQSFETATFGQTFYHHTFVPRCWIAPKLNGQAYQAGTDVTFQVTPTASGRRLTGNAFSTDLTLEGNKATHYHTITSNPLYMFAYRANGTTVTMTSAYKPVSSTVGTASNTANSIVVFNDTTLVATNSIADTVNTTTGAIAAGTSGATIASGDMVYALHETNFVPV